MENSFLQNLKRLEFLITFACTGQCKHCSEGEHAHAGEFLRGDIAAEMVRKVAENYSIDSLMTFGGEPLLYPEVVCKIHAAASDAGIPQRQVITNGFFSKDEDKIRSVAENLAASGVNDLLLSVDAFHQETIPLEPVLTFAKAVIDAKIPNFRVHPAWLVGEDADNPYNNKTREILVVFNAIGIPTSSGNVVFPSGNALKYLGEYFDMSKPHVSPYAENPSDITAICVVPNGEILGSNIYEADILEILEKYVPAAEKAKKL